MHWIQLIKLETTKYVCIVVILYHPSIHSQIHLSRVVGYFIFLTKHIQISSACVIMLKIQRRFLTILASELQSLSYLPAKSNKPNNSPQRTAKIPSHHIRLKWGRGSEVRVLLIWGAREGSAEQKIWWDWNGRRKRIHVWDSSLLPSATFTEKTWVDFDMPMISLWHACKW